MEIADGFRISSPRVLVQTWCSGWENFASTTVRSDLTTTDRGTRVDVTHTGFTETAASRGHADGWTRVPGWLGDHFAS